jgi:leucyl/phenylalanyl-tRNA--protein transferase
MAILEFPPVETADEDGLLAIGGDLEPTSILLAYSKGIFPWPLDEALLAWFAPPQRAVLFIEEFHVGRSLMKALRRAGFRTSVDTAFAEVIGRCAEVKNRGDQGSTWITDELREAYIQLHALGFTHSFETYLGDTLVGGIYGLQLGRFFAAESSFYRRDNASKAAMIAMVEYLRQQGIAWFDCQVLTPFSASFGAREIPRSDFMRLLSAVHQAAG